MAINKININKIEFGGTDLPLIAGPCVIEGRDHALKMAESIASVAANVGLPYIFKTSFDKANRTAIDAFRGPGFENGLEILSDIKAVTGLPILTDIHLPEQAASVADIVDIIQIPAFLCRQTDLLIAAAKTGKCVNVKKGQFISPWKMSNIVKKLEESGAEQILLTERGSSYGYNDLIVDLRSIPIMQEFGYPVVFDATHSAQVPGVTGSMTQGLREYIPTMVKAAVAAGCNGLFMEVHDDVESAKSDAATQWPLDKLEELLILAKNYHSIGFKNVQ
jgi:2-dehydro-3-deoxyphosphooctonate aldolase (KDO 8-P synthase)